MCGAVLNRASRNDGDECRRMIAWNRPPSRSRSGVAALSNQPADRIDPAQSSEASQKRCRRIAAEFAAVARWERGRGDGRLSDPGTFAREMLLRWTQVLRGAMRQATALATAYRAFLRRGQTVPNRGIAPRCRTCTTRIAHHDAWA